MKTVFHKSNLRGHADHGWLQSSHSFSFAGFHDPQKMSFGLLRVLNDDRVAAGMGFGNHGHSNMEIISIPLKGALKHQDNMGNTSVIKTNEVQIMSAGSGIEHSEFNSSSVDEVNFLQIWILPKRQDIKPRYEQKYFEPANKLNQWQLVVSPDSTEAIWINQNASISRASLDPETRLSYQMQMEGQGVYLFLLNGSIEAEGQKLERRDALGIWDSNEFTVNALAESELLAIEVPMQFAR